MKKRIMKRLLAGTMSLVLLVCVVPTVSAYTQLRLGDVNMDGRINTSDSRLVIDSVVNSYNFTSDQMRSGDMNGSGALDTADAREILSRIVRMDENLIPLSGAEDVTDTSGYRTYTMYAEYTDTYTFSCSKASSITVVTDNGTVTGTTSASKYILAGEYCTVTIRTSAASTKFDLEVTPQNNTYRRPYDADFTVDPDLLDTVGDSSVDPLEAAQISYSKRDGGTYIYANNPEKLQSADIGKALLRTESLTGDVEFTYEHSNFTGGYIYLGYQLKNTGSSDVYVTVTNVGIQVDGEWLGQRSWSDYYNRKFNLPDDYFTYYGTESSRYEGQGFLNYTPRVYQPTTYRIPAGQYIYVLGGTSGDAYNNTNVASTANRLVYPGYCSNGVVKFHVTGGEVTGTFYCYSAVSQVKAEPAEQGYITDRNGTAFGLQYKGVDYHQGLLENNMIWYVNDNTADGDLPVTHQTNYDMYSYLTRTPYEEYFNPVIGTANGTSWITNINPQNERTAVGTDMMSFECMTTDGKTVTIDTQHADAYGTAANLGNWMVDYHDNMTFVNQGDTTRYFTINKLANGGLMSMVLDNEGQVLATKCAVSPATGSADESQWEVYTVEVAPHSVVQVTVNFLLMGNSYGAVKHWVTLD